MNFMTADHFQNAELSDCSSKSLVQKTFFKKPRSRSLGLIFETHHRIA